MARVKAAPEEEAPAPRDVVVSGARPTGKLHLGHLNGALKSWLDLQQRSDCFFFVADWHALTTEYADTAAIRANVESMVLDWLAVGVDPERAVLFTPIDGAAARRAVPHVLDGGADSVARAGADLQGAARAARGQRPHHLRVSRLSVAAGRRHPHLQGGPRFRSARISSRTSSSRARWRAASIASIRWTYFPSRPAWSSPPPECRAPTDAR